MMKDPNTIPVPEIKRQPLHRLSQMREYRLITPLFGGGATPKQADAITTLRVPEIRGQLRFWWRAIRGWQFDGDLAAMKSAEDAIWGSASQPSRVSLAITACSSGQDITDPLDNRGVPRYAVFPIEEDKKNRIVNPLKTQVTFTLQVSLSVDPKDKQPVQPEVEAALWAWENFGGIGGRTRRGFGALQCLRVDGTAQPVPKQDTVEKVLRAGLDRYIQGNGWPADVPHLSPGMSMRTVGARDATDAWKTLINGLRRFRQNRPDTRHTVWPEPNALRRINDGKSAPREGFPRAAFGLPIIFHFPKEPRLDNTLVSQESDRLASPLILRPLVCANDGAVGLAAVLTAPQADRLQLAGKYGGRVEPIYAMTDAQAKTIDPTWDHRTDILSAFLDSLSD